MINRQISLFLILFLFWSGTVFAIPSEPLKPLFKHRLSTVLITKFIDMYHYKKSNLNDAQSSKIYKEYLDSLDPNHNIFIQSDIDTFSKFEFKLDNALIEGDLTAAFVIFKKFNQRRIERAEYALQHITDTLDFTINETYLFDRTDSAWPKDKNELDMIWRKRVKNDYLTLSLANKKASDIRETLKKRYKRFKKRSVQIKAEDTYELFINAYLRSLEPHTAYFSPRTSENFTINMSLSLEGIGAVLQTIDEHTIVRRVVKGGPAELSHMLHAGDKIIGVGQDSGKVEDIIGWRLDDVVAKIRGPKDSVVQLHILPADGGPGGSDRYITLIRNKIKLEDQQVQKSIIEIPDGDTVQKIGVIEIPTFYMDFAAANRGEKDFRSTTRDTIKLLQELKAENVSGIVVDLRSNGGGSLIEAVSLTGLFIKDGPVVQIRKSNGDIQVNEDKDSSITYNGPLAVLVDRNSASASEIFAGAIKDYGRGLIIGEPTFGKGTVQRIINLNNYTKKSGQKLGQLKITMAQFFRVNGDSTQHRGVVPDIIFPTAIKSDEEGERSLANALPWAKIAEAKFNPVNQIPKFLDNLREKHKKRIKQDTGFNFLLYQAKFRHEIMQKKELSLLKSKRKNRREEQEITRHEQLNKFRASRGLKTHSLVDDIKEANNTKDEIKSIDKNKKLNEELRLILLREAATILVDLNLEKSRNQISMKASKKGLSVQ